MLSLTTSNFSTAIGAVDTGGGGGRSPLTASIVDDVYVAGLICKPFKDAWATSLAESEFVVGEFDKIIFLWSSFWNYALCSGSASTIVPL